VIAIFARADFERDAGGLSIWIKRGKLFSGEETF
jgi:hypothetical protein